MRSHPESGLSAVNELANRKIPQLSKSRFLSGLQCHKRLYYECFHRDLADPIDVAQQAIFDAGTSVGELARDMYPGGALVDYDHFHHAAAVSATKTMITNYSVPAIYEAGFQFNDVRTRIDILARTERDMFDLVEVKSTTSVKPDHIPDVAVQFYVLNGSEIPLRRSYLAHLNKEYIYPGGQYNLNELFNLDDVTDAVELVQSDIPELLNEMKSMLGDPEPPDIKSGKHCSQPYTCLFYGHCHINEPEHHISQLPRANEKLLRRFEEAGIEDIRDIAMDFVELNELQRRVRDCVVNNETYFNPSCQKELAKLEFPIHFLDFETFNPALPLYVGTRPYQVIPFQWSDHVMDSDGNLTHFEFLHDGFDDPREPFAKSLIQTLGTSGSIVVYSSFEATRIRELADALSHLSRDLHALLDGRIFDIHPVIKKHCYHPEFHGSFSLKSVLPALVPDLGYDDLEITDGAQASVAYAEIISPSTASSRRNFLRASLLSYCKRDTEAMVRLFQTLRQ